MIPSLMMFVTLTVIFIYQVKCWSRQDVQTLHDHLFQDYNKDLGPQFNQTASINIQISFDLHSIKDFEDKTGKLSIIGYFHLKWTDDRMSWDPLQHHNITSIKMQVPKVWTPSLFIGRPYYDIKKVGNELIEINYDNSGEAFWILPDLYDIACAADIAYYPFDTQLCEMHIIPWGYKATEFDFDLPYNTMTKYDFIENGMWRVLSTEIRIVNHKYSDYVVMSVKFQRRPLFAICILLLPIGIVAALNPLVFLLPPDPGERSSYCVTIMLAMAVFLSTVADKLPTTSEPHLARVCVYLLVDLISSGICMLFTILGLKLHNQKNAPIPEWIKRVVLTCSKRQRHPIENDSNRSKTPKWRQIKVQPTSEQSVNQKDNDKDIDQPGNIETLRDGQNINDHAEVVSVNDINKSCSWNDVAKLFDKFCLILSIFLQICRLSATTIDSMVYISSDL